MDVLPCQGCANHYKENIANVPIDDHLKDRESLLRWTFDIHNEVNKLKGKPILSYEDALKLYTQKQFPALDVLCKVLVLLAILVFLYFLILHKQ